MKKFLILVTVVMIATTLVLGCVGGVETYTDSGRTISVSVNRVFIIGLGSNPTTGYGWQESYDETMLEMVGEKEYEPGAEAKEGVVGAGGVEFFRFKALKKGTTEITLVYKRGWEEEIIDKKLFTVDIR